MAKRDIGTALIISVLFAFPTALLFSFAPGYSDSLLVPNLPLEDYRTLSYEERQELLHSDNGLRPISGIEKVGYLLRSTPDTYILKSSILWIPLFLVSIISSVLVRRNEKT
jgi:hypothetical protein